MPQYVALKTFKSADYGAINRGMTYTLPDHYGSQLVRGGLARPLAIEHAPRNAAHEGAPKTAGEDLAVRLDDGKAPQSSVSPPARRSRKRIVSTSSPEPAEPTLQK